MSAADDILREFLKKRQKQNQAPEPSFKSMIYTDTEILLGFIKNGKTTDFRNAPKFINNEDRLKLAKVIVTQYKRKDSDQALDVKKGDPGDPSDEETKPPTSPASPSNQTQEYWLGLLMEALAPDTNARRNLAEELIKITGYDETRQDPPQRQSDSQLHPNYLILLYLIETTEGLYSEKDSMEQTLFHTAAIHGALGFITISLSVIYDCCNGIDTDHIPGCKKVTNLLKSRDKEDHSPLTYAITKGRISVVKYILNLLGNSDPEEIRENLKKAITIGSGNNVDIVRELLIKRPTEGEQAYQTDVVKQDILELAAKHFDLEVFKFLLSIGSTVLSSANCSLMHYVVYIGRVEAAKYLLKQFPDLATKFHLHPDPTARLISNTTMGRQMVKNDANDPDLNMMVNDEKLPLLALYESDETELRDLIFQILMQRLPISELRDHLGGRTWKGKEISLDVTILAFDPPSLAEFLNFVRSDLKKHEECAYDTGKGPVERLQPEKPAINHPEHYNSAVIEFESMLKYVNIPSFIDQLGEKRTEAVSILKWLKCCKRVTRVFEVIVDDCRYCPSTEEDIEMALKDLGVQHLDWRRTDLSITSIEKVAKDLKTLHLYSSGNLGTIDHWIGPNGINILNLDQLHIHIIQDNLNGQERVNMCKRLCDEGNLKVTTKPVVTIEPWTQEPARHSHHGFSRSAKQRPIEVTGLKHFVESYITVQEDRMNSLVNHHQPHLFPPKPIPYSKTKVAILDSGVNGTRFPLQLHKHHGRSFVWKNNRERHQSEASWWLAIDPHGSHMANIISQIDPFCEFYFFQITDDMNYIETSAVVKALECAIKCQVDVINCSFALNEPSENLEKVLRKAKGEDIIIMCSTADEGQNTDQVWPAAYYSPDKDRAEKFHNIFPIVGCDEHGKFSRYANEKAGRYMFRGEDINASSTYLPLPIVTKNVQGSSVATAIATGVSCLIIACYRMVRNDLTFQSSLPDLVDACFFKMSENIRKNISPSQTPLLVKVDNLFPVEEDQIRDSDHFLENMRSIFDQIS